MELVFFVEEFFSELANLFPALAAIAVASLVLFLYARRRQIERPAVVSLVSVILSVLAIFAVHLLAAIGVGDLVIGVIGEVLLWVGLGLTVILAWPFVWFVAVLLNRRQLRSKLRDTSAFL